MTLTRYYPVEISGIFQANFHKPSFLLVVWLICTIFAFAMRME